MNTHDRRIAMQQYVLPHLPMFSVDARERELLVEALKSSKEFLCFRIDWACTRLLLLKFKCRCKERHSLRQKIANSLVIKLSGGLSELYCTTLTSYILATASKNYVEKEDVIMLRDIWIEELLRYNS